MQMPSALRTADRGSVIFISVGSFSLAPIRPVGEPYVRSFPGSAKS